MPPTNILGVAVIEDAVTKSFDQFFDKGVLGAVVVVLLIGIGFGGLVIRFLYNEGRAREKELVALLERVLTVLEGSKVTAGQNADNVARLTGVLDSVEKAIKELNHDIETSGQENRHGIANLGMMITSVVEVLKDLRRKGSE